MIFYTRQGGLGGHLLFSGQRSSLGRTSEDFPFETWAMAGLKVYRLDMARHRASTLREDCLWYQAPLPFP